MTRSQTTKFVLRHPMSIESVPVAKTAIQYVRVLPGDHLAVKSHETWHHGIFVGRTFRETTYEHDMVVQTGLRSLHDFGGENLIYRIDYDDHDEDMARVRRARACVKASQTVANPHEQCLMWCTTNPDQLPHHVSSYLDHKVFGELDGGSMMTRWRPNGGSMAAPARVSVGPFHGRRCAF